MPGPDRGGEGRGTATACGITHGFSDATCIRRPGHNGRCWSRWQNGPQDGHITRAEWISQDGKFWQHGGYVDRFVGGKRG